MPKKRDPAIDTFLLHLYIPGCTPRSQRAIESVRALCERRLKDRYRLEIIDMYKHPDKVRDEQIFASPTLFKVSPLPEAKIIGDMSNSEKILSGLGLT
jgi:circadian clock protein KaiB